MADELETVGFMNAGKSGKSFSISIGKDKMGFITKAFLERLLAGEIKGAPIKKFKGGN